MGGGRYSPRSFESFPLRCCVLFVESCPIAFKEGWSSYAPALGLLSKQSQAAGGRLRVSTTH